MAAVKIDVNASFKDLGDALLRKLAASDPRHKLLSQEAFTSYQQRFLMLHDAVKAVETQTAELSPADTNKEYHRTLKWFPNRSASLRIGAAILQQSAATPTQTLDQATLADCARMRETFVKSMSHGQYYDPFVCIIIISVLSALTEHGNGPVLMLLHLLLERRDPAYVYTLFNWVFALPAAEQSRFWSRNLSNSAVLSPFELANGAAINAAAFPIMPNWPGLAEVNRTLLGSVPLIGAGSDMPTASKPPPPNTYPSSQFGSSHQVRVRAGPALASFFEQPLTGAGYSLPVTDGYVDLTVVESHFGTLKAEVDAIKAKLEATQKERDALNRKVNDLQSRLSRAGVDLAGKNKGKPAGLRGSGGEGEL